MAEEKQDQTAGGMLVPEGDSKTDAKLTLYHWTQSFSSQKVGGSSFCFQECQISGPGQLPGSIPPTLCVAVVDELAVLISTQMHASGGGGGRMKRGGCRGQDASPIGLRVHPVCIACCPFYAYQH